MTTKIETHENAVTHAACALIESGISTISGPTRGIDLITDDNKTILVRGVSGEVAIPLMNGTLDTLKADYLVIVTRIDTRCNRRIYIMTMDEAKRLAGNSPYRDSGRNNYFISPELYKYYRDDYRVFK